MTNFELLQSVLRDLGRKDALELRSNAPSMTETELIQNESKVPSFDPKKDYSSWPAGAPVNDEDQVWVLLQPYNAANYEGRPSTLRALWGLCHTKDPHHAKPFVEPLGMSGVYMTDECVLGSDGLVYQCLQDNVVYSPEDLPSVWSAIQLPEV